MTTIILVSVGILLAAVAALMVVFYGGDAFSGSADKADAARLVSEGVQIEAAFQTFRVQEDRYPGTGNGVDAAAVKDLLCRDYLTQLPRGIAEQATPTYTEAECASPVVKTAGSPWKIDYNFGIARSIVGNAQNPDGSESRAYAICRAARRQVGLQGDPKRCDASDITSAEPCCVMSAADAAL